MNIWSGRRKSLIVLLFIAPTLLGILFFNVYPIIYNTYISFTNFSSTAHPRPDCEYFLTSVIAPNCWPAFRQNARPNALATPWKPNEDLLANYKTLVGDLFSPTALLAFGQLLLVAVPLIVAGQVNRYYDRQLTRPVSPLLVWLLAALAVVLLALLFDAQGAFATLQTSGVFFIVLFRTILYVLACVPLFFILGLALAIILNSPHIRGRTFFRAAMIIPWAASTMAIMVSLIWKFFFNERGTINQLLGLVDIKGPIWLRDPNLAFFVIVLVNLWYSYPFFFNIILGALQSIPADQYEAAEVDGATFWQQLTNITLPLIRPAVLPAMVLSAITTFQMFGTVWAITQGGPPTGAGQPGFTELAMIYVYRQAGQYGQYGRAGAFAVIIFIFLFLATLYSLRVTRITKGAYE